MTKPPVIDIVLVRKVYGNEVQNVYGVFLGSDKRQFVVIYYGMQRRKSVPYGRLLLELSLGRKLTSDETCDHIDGDFYNNETTNLQVLSIGDNIRKSSTTKMITLICSGCGKSFERAAYRFKNGIAKSIAYRCKQSCYKS